MNIDELTIGEAKTLAGMFSTQQSATKHPLNGQRVLAVLPNGFIHFGTLRDLDGRYSLTNASNLRSWKQRDGGLSEFAKTGPTDGDQLDYIGIVHIETLLFFYPLGDWS